MGDDIAVVDEERAEVGLAMSLTAATTCGIFMMTALLNLGKSEGRAMWRARGGPILGTDCLAIKPEFDLGEER